MNRPVTYPLAKLLNEKGFDKNTEANWWILAKDHSENYKKGLPVDESKIFFTEDSHELDRKIQIDEEKQHNVFHVLSAPTVDEVKWWLYEKHSIWISCNHYGGLNFPNMCFYYIISGQTKDGQPIRGQIYNSPTETYEAAIEYTLNNLL